MADTPGDQPAIERRNSLKGVTLGGAAALAGTEARALPGAAESDFFAVREAGMDRPRVASRK